MSLYMPFRTIGVLSGDVPHQLCRLGDQNFLSVACGPFIQVFRTDKLTVSMMIKVKAGDISHLQVQNHNSFVAVKNRILHYQRNKLISELNYHKDSGAACVTSLLLVGDALVSVDNTNGVYIYNISEREVSSKLNILNTANITSISHPSTYVNKFLFGYDNGDVELWNVRTCRLVYRFKCLNAILTTVEKKAVSCLCQSPSVDVMTVGFASGDIVVFNMKSDQKLFHFVQQGSVTAMSYRSDAAADRQPFLVTASNNGHLYTWRIGSGLQEDGSFTSSNSKLMHTLRRAHDNGILSIDFLHGEPVLISTGMDNSIKMWIFDHSDGINSPRLLRSRQGPQGSARELLLFGEAGYDSDYGNSVAHSTTGLLSADDHGGVFFSRLDRHGLFDRFSSATLLKGLDLDYLPPVTGMDAEYVNSREWGDMVTIHEGWDRAVLWRVENKAAIPKLLQLPKELRKPQSKLKYGACTAVALSPCGHFAVFAFESGLICKFNLQSGLLRGSFPTEAIPQRLNTIDATAKLTSSSLKGFQKHESKVYGLFVDSTSSRLVSVDIDGNLAFWSFQRHALEKSLVIPCGRDSEKKSIMVGHRDSNLIAVGDEKGTIRIFDLSSLQLARVFFTTGAEELPLQLTTMIFSPDGRQLLSGASDGSLRVWDTPTGRCVSWMRFDGPVASLAFTAGMELLVSRKGRRGIMLLVDRTLSAANVMLPSEEPRAAIDVSDWEQLLPLQPELDIDEPITTSDIHAMNNVEKREDAGLQMSSLPRAYWLSIFKMEELRRRKNIILPVKRKSTPFFLPSLEPALKPGSDADADQRAERQRRVSEAKRKALNDVTEEGEEDSNQQKLTNQSRVLRGAKNFNQSHLVQVMVSSNLANNKNGVLELKRMSPAEIDIELRMLCLSETNGEGLRQLSLLLRRCISFVHQTDGFEIIQAFLHRLLQLHSGKIMRIGSLQAGMKEIRGGVEDTGSLLRDLIQIALCLTKTYLGIPVI